MDVILTHLKATKSGQLRSMFFHILFRELKTRLIGVFDLTSIWTTHLLNLY